MCLCPIYFIVFPCLGWRGYETGRKKFDRHQNKPSSVLVTTRGIKQTKRKQGVEKGHEQKYNWMTIEFIKFVGIVVGVCTVDTISKDTAVKQVDNSRGC